MATPHQKHGKKSHLKMLFDGDTLFLFGLKCLKGKDEQFPATSGNDKSEPIPNGLYWIQTDEIHEMKWSDDWTPNLLGFSKPTLFLHQLFKKPIGALPNALMLHMGAWGEYRIPIRQTIAQQNSTGRSAMFIHGGDNPGSAGCIDLTYRISMLVAFLRKEHPAGESFSINLTVQRGGKATK
jgi:hypothetical protein